MKKAIWKPKLTTRARRPGRPGAERKSPVSSVWFRRPDLRRERVWGLQWFTNYLGPKGWFPQYYKNLGDERVAVAAAEVPVETKLLAREFKVAGPGEAYTSPTNGAWGRPGPKLGPFTARLADGSVVTYSWYRFIEQPSFQQYHWSAEKKAGLQAFVEELHANWPLDQNYAATSQVLALVSLDPALLVTPPKGLEVGYVPIVTHQARVTSTLKWRFDMPASVPAELPA